MVVLDLAYSWIEGELSGTGNLRSIEWVYPDGRERYWGGDIPPGLGCGGLHLLVSMLSSSDEGS